MFNRFYLNGSLEDTATMVGLEFHHLAHVMRAKVGDVVELINGDGVLAKARIDEISKNSASFSIESREVKPKPTALIHIGLPIIRLERLEWAIEKGTELGADSFHLFSADFSEKKHLSEHQFDRLHNISIAAIKQCDRLFLPSFHLAHSLSDILQSKITMLYGDIDPNAPMLNDIPFDFPLLFISGPEKGFSEKEIALLKEHGKGIHLHPNILRAETAPIVALSLLSQRKK